MSIKVEIAVGVGYEFTIVDTDKVRHIDLVKTDKYVRVDGLSYSLYKGKTYEDSRLVDNILDNAPKCYQTSEHLVELSDTVGNVTSGKGNYEVTVTKTAKIKVRVAPEKLHTFMKTLKDEDFTWGDFEVTNIEALE